MKIHNLSSEEVAELLGVTDRAVRKWAAEGLPHHAEGKDLRFDWPQVLPWWAANKHRGSVVMPKGIPSKAESEARLLKIRADREALKLAEVEGRMIDLQAVEDDWTRKILACRAPASYTTWWDSSPG